MRSKELQTLGDVLQILKIININPLYFIVPILLTLGAAAFEGASLGLLMPLLNGFLTKDFSFVAEVPGMNMILEWISGGEALRDRTIFLILIGVFSVAVLFKNILKFGSSLSMMYLATRSTHHLRKALFAQYLSFGKLYFDKSTLGHHNIVLTQFTNYALMPILMVDRLFQAVISLAVYTVILSFISWKLTLIAMPVFIILQLMLRFIISGIQKLSGHIAEHMKDIGKKTAEILATISLVKVTNQEGDEQNRFTAISDHAAKLEFKKHALQRLMAPVQEIATLFAVLFLFAGMLYLLVGEGDGSTAPMFLVYFYVVLNAATKFAAVTSFRGDVASVHGQVTSVLAVLQEKKAYRVPDGKEKFCGLKEGVDVQNLSFSYSDGKNQLEDVSFSMKKGTVVALVGPTGSGKTTLTNLLLRFYDCPPNTILLDGKDIRSFTASSLRDHMALVSQETFLLHDTLKANITYGVDASDEQIDEAVKRARLAELVQRLPDGLNTLIGDRGVKLSGGEKQRVSIARAFVKHSDVLILDEATSALDSVTERLVQEAIDEAISNKTALVIAHRLSTIKNADQIVVLEDGRTVETGSLQELLEKKGLFAKLWEEQKFS